MRIFTTTLHRMTLDFSAAQHLSHELFAALKPTEALFVEIASESSQFIRFNRARVRQIGTVEDTVVTLRLQSQQRTASTSFPYTGTADLAAALDHLAQLRSETVQLPLILTLCHQRIPLHSGYLPWSLT